MDLLEFKREFIMSADFFMNNEADIDAKGTVWINHSNLEIHVPVCETQIHMRMSYSLFALWAKHYGFKRSESTMYFTRFSSLRVPGWDQNLPVFAGRAARDLWLLPWPFSQHPFCGIDSTSLCICSWFPQPPSDSDLTSSSRGGWGNQEHMQRLVESIRKNGCCEKGHGRKPKVTRSAPCKILAGFDPSPEREGLENLVKYIVDRNV